MATIETSPRERAEVQTAVAVRISDRALADRRYRNELIWANPSRWRCGFYFGEGDTRLWVPRRRRGGRPDCRRCVINFCHEEGRTALPILALAYVSGALLVTLGALALLAVR